jgi:hypothetical protein
MIPLDVTMLACADPLAVNVPDDAVIPAVNVPEDELSP